MVFLMLLYGLVVLAHQLHIMFRSIGRADPIAAGHHLFEETTPFLVGNLIRRDLFRGNDEPVFTLRKEPKEMAVNCLLLPAACCTGNPPENTGNNKARNLSSVTSVISGSSIDNINLLRKSAMTLGMVNCSRLDYSCTANMTICLL